MARTTRKAVIAAKNNHVVPEQKKVEIIYRTGMYKRLSVEDGGIGEDCESLENQEALLREFIDRKPDLKLVSVYCDNGETGTNFTRPGFQKMMEDVRCGKINCIVVKDLSRFGRNYIETGELVEKVFPFLGTRFIAVNDDFDTHDPDCKNDTTVFSLKNIINEAYARDISSKILSAFDAKRKNGEMNIKNAPYGYMLSGDPKHPYIIDEDVADNVRMIFRMKAEGVSTNSIVKHMEAAGYLTPLQYLKSKGWVKKCRDNSHWDMTAINRILTNPIYLGHMVQGKTVSRFCDNIPEKVIPRSDWVIYENINEPIIDRELYDSVQKIVEQQKAEHKARCGKYDYLSKEAVLKSIVFCADCGKPMFRYKNVVSPKSCIYYYICPTYRMHKEAACPNKQGVREDYLLSIVWGNISKDIALLDSLECRMEKIIGSSDYQKKLGAVEQEIRKTDGELKKFKAYLLSVFENHCQGKLPESDYLYYKNQYEMKIEVDTQRLSELFAQRDKLNAEAPTENRWMSEFRRFRDCQQLTPEIVAALVERVEIGKGKEVTITLKYRSELDSLLKNTENMESDYNA